MAESPFTNKQRKAVDAGLSEAATCEWWLQLLRRAGVPNENLEAQLLNNKRVLEEFKKIEEEFMNTH